MGARPNLLDRTPGVVGWAHRPRPAGNPQRGCRDAAAPRVAARRRRRSDRHSRRRAASRAAPPIRGIMHAASVWENQDGKSLVRAILHLDAASFAQVFQPKVTGTWLLQRQLAEVDYDFLVLFSSAASICGSAGQGNYAAAGTFLDAMAHELRARGKRALSVNWGAIGGTGFGASPEGLKVHEFWEKQGIGRIGIDQVLGALERVLFKEFPQIGVMNID